MYIYGTDPRVFQVKNITYCKFKFPPSPSLLLSHSLMSWSFIILCSDLAKVSPHILNPERFALHLATFLVSKYAHITKSFVTIEQLRWTRICIKKGDDDVKPVDDRNGHPHSFIRDGNDKRVVKVEVFFLFMFDYFLTYYSFSSSFDIGW